MMWSVTAALLFLFSFSKCSPQKYIYIYNQARAVTPQSDNASTSLPATAPAPSLFDAHVLQEVFGLPNNTAVVMEAPDGFNPSNQPHDEFDWKLTKQLAITTEENLLVSPFGLKLALAILTEAATGATASELQFTLGFHTNASHVQAKFQHMLDSLLKKSDLYTLEFGSRIYVSKEVEPRQKFAAKAEQHYSTQVKKLEPAAPGAAALDINTWISNITHGRIPQLVSQSDLNNAVMLVLNTLYFKGTWRHQFEPNDTRIEYFYVTPAKIVSVPFMTMQNTFFFSESVRMQAKILRLPYLGNKFSLYLVVPNSVTGLSRVLQEMTSQQLARELSFLQPRQVRVTMPRFQFQYASHLDAALRKLGIVHAFEQTASFPGIARGEGTDTIRISRVVQKSGIEVNELGSVVYTATEVSLVNRFGDEDDGAGAVEVKANKPFVFYIEDETTKTLLFTGRISNPAESTGRPT